MEQKNKNIGRIEVLLAGCLWGTMGILARTMKGMGAGSLEIVEFRALITVLILGGYCLLRNRRIFYIKWRDLWCFIGTGILSISFFNLCYFTTMNRVSLSVAAVLLYTAPAFVVLMSFFLFKEELNRNKILAVLMAVLGCCFVSGLFESILGGEFALSPRDLLVGLGSGFGYALYSIFIRYALNRGYASMTITFYSFFICAIGMLPFSTPQHLIQCMREVPEGIVPACLAVLFNTIIANVVYTAGMKPLENGQAAVLASVEPVVATILGIALYGEGFTFSNLLGIGMILGSIVLINWKKREE